MADAPIVLLAPSEDKAEGGRPGTLEETPEQQWVREKLVALARKGTAAAKQKAFEVKGEALERACAEALALAKEPPLLPALERYTGVAFEALNAETIARERWSQVYVLSTLRGLVRGDELVPSYKLKLAGLTGLKAHWKKALPSLLETLPEGPVWALLPQDSMELLSGWSRPLHTADIVDSKGKTVSHWSKLYRGRLARWILEHNEGDPALVKKAKLKGCTVKLSGNNDHGGKLLRLTVT